MARAASVILFLIACGGTPAPVRPASVPAEMPSLRFVDEQIQLDGDVVISWRELSQESGEIPELHGRLDEKGVWMAIPETARWTDARRLLATALNHGPVHLGDLQQAAAVGPYRGGHRGEMIASCADGPIKVLGYHPRLTLEIHNDDGQAWVNASVRFLPVVLRDGKRLTANLFQDACWAPTRCDGLGEAEQACRTGPDAVGTVRVAGAVGCFLPLGKGLHGHTSWRTEIPEVMRSLGFNKDSEVLVTATEEVPYGAVLSVLSGLQAFEITPVIGTLRMGSRAGPPICNIPIHNAAQLATAGQAWYGHNLNRANQEPR